MEALRSCIDVLKRRDQPAASAAPCWAAHGWSHLWVQPRQTSRWIGHHPEADKHLCPLTHEPSESSPKSGIFSCFERLSCCLFYSKLQRIPLLPLEVKCCHEFSRFWCECDFVDTTCSLSEVNKMRKNGYMFNLQIDNIACFASPLGHFAKWKHLFKFRSLLSNDEFMGVTLRTTESRTEIGWFDFPLRKRPFTAQMFTLAEQRRGEQAGGSRAWIQGDAGSCILPLLDNVRISPPVERAFPEFFCSSASRPDLDR